MTISWNQLLFQYLATNYDTCVGLITQQQPLLVFLSLAILIGLIQSLLPGQIPAAQTKMPIPLSVGGEWRGKWGETDLGPRKEDSENARFRIHLTKYPIYST